MSLRSDEVARENTASFQSAHLGYSTSGSTGSFICPAMAVTEGQLAVRRHLRLLNEDRPRGDATVG